MTTTKYIFITGGVLSGLGKGITTASIGKILQARGYNVTAIKIDPYLNVDAGTMNPFQHGEVFVTFDGGETDLDLGHYERFLDVEIPKYHNITSGQVYYTVIRRERRGKYLGQTVQLIPHVTEEVKRRIMLVTKRERPDIVLIEIGGTIGDYEGLPFLEAARQMRLEMPNDVLFVHVALVPMLTTTGELKTKPLQHSVAELRRVGIQPDIIIARSPRSLDSSTKRKISLFTNVPIEAVFTSYDVDTIYKVPLILEEQGLGKYITSKLGLNNTEPKLNDWISFINALENSKEVINVYMCGKYVKLHDSYISIVEAIKHASAKLMIKPNIVWCDTEEFEKEPSKVTELNNADAIIVLPGFGARGVEGKIEAIRYARENNIPFLGICYGMQLAVVEFARNVVGLRGAHTTEVDPNTPYPVIDITPEERSIKEFGGTMILGDRRINIAKGTIANTIYGTTEIRERHRHRYEVNPAFFKVLTEKGLVFSAWRADVPRVEMIEIPNHFFFVATQFHPEFKSRPLKPHPLFVALLKAAYNKSMGYHHHIVLNQQYMHNQPSKALSLIRCELPHHTINPY
ncbi:MAG: CTP synthase [Vulcanisaeta sp. AZ3]|jgi:CTP synthase